MHEKLKNAAQIAITNKIFPGVCMGVIFNNKVELLHIGTLTYDQESQPVTDNTVYDLASITKVIPTASVILHLADQGKIKLDDKIIDFLPELTAKNRQEITIKHLLTYTVAFKLLPLSELAHQGGHAIMQSCFTAPLVDKPGATFLYTNMVSTLLALIAERVSGKKLPALASDLFFKPLGMKATTFTPKTAAPTEIDWRGTVAGEVHDESAWALTKAGLTAGHAGLFSTAGDLLKFARMLLNNGVLGDQRFFSPNTVRQMYTNQLKNSPEKIGLGWVIPGGKFAFFGSNVSGQAFGMTGFTGTSFLVDPGKQRALVILSNASYPKRKNDKEIMNEFRRKVADIVFGD